MIDGILYMKQKPTEQELETLYGWLVENVHIVYNKLINVRPIKPPYSKLIRPNRFFLKTRPWFRDRMNTVLVFLRTKTCTDPEDESTCCYTYWDIILQWDEYNRQYFWKFTDIITLSENINGTLHPFEYWMWISQDKTTMKIFKTEDWCNLYEIYSDCFCNCWFEYFMPINFLKWKPKSLYIDPVWDVTSAWGSTYQGSCWIQQNYTYYQSSKSLASMQDNYVDNSTIRRNTIWDNAIEVWDYLYAYGVNSDCSSQTSWICWQVNQVAWINQLDWRKLMLLNYWAWFDQWQIDSTKITWARDYYELYGSLQGLDNSFYITWKEPQTLWYNMEYMVFSDYGETFAFQTCDGIKVFHYHDYNDFCKDAVVTKFCNYSWCYTDGVLYSWRNGVQHAVFLDSARSVMLYSDGWNIWYLWAGNTLPIRWNTYGMTSFQNYVVYFWEHHIWAFYIDAAADKLTATNRFVANWWMVKWNTWWWINPNWRFESFAEYDNSLYFIWSNKRLYRLDVTTNDWLIIPKSTDMTDDAWARRIIGDLEWIDKSDYVYMQADDDKLRIFINGSSVNNGVSSKTKILTYRKRWKIRTTDISCCAVVSKYKQWLCWEYMIWDNIYDECWDFDCQNVNVEYDIQLYIGEDEQSVLKWNHSFNNKYLDYFITQIGKNTREVLWDTILTIKSNAQWLKPVYTNRNLFDTPYLQAITAINNWEEPVVTECMLESLKDCQEFTEECKWDTWIQYDVELYDCLPNQDELIVNCNGYKYKRCNGSCQCTPEKKIDDYCFCYDDRKHHLSDFINIYSSIWIKWNLFDVELRWHDCIEFWWFFIWVYTANSPKDVTDCQKRNCEWCEKRQSAQNNTNKCF